MRKQFVSNSLALVALGAAIVAGANTLQAGEEPLQGNLAPRAAASQLWLVSTRALPHGSQHSSRRLVPQVELYEAGDVWRPSSLDELVAARDSRLTTIVLVHGNDTVDPRARSKGLGIYQALAENAERPLRLIVWSWPADYLGGTLRHDARVKAERADVDAYYLAQFIGQLDPDEALSLVGYSFGARVVSGALQLVGGGSLAGRISGRNDPRAPIRAVLLAAAIDDDWLLPGHRYGHALSVVERLVVLVNPQDRVLRFYRFLAPGTGAAALGAHGLPSPAGLEPHLAKIEQIDVGPLVGVQHGWSSYARCPDILEQIRRETLLGANRRSQSGLGAR
ncbi:MAG TPA: hypothetical protein VG826_01575 [Pirellulales bacterium]|nr:hypothetical protein [Pirellulales bacterium]